MKKKVLSFVLSLLLIASTAVIGVSAETTESSTIITFEQPKDWTDFKNMYCHIWMYNDDGSVMWPAWQSRLEKMTDNGDGTWSYDVSKLGENVINPEKGASYGVVFSNDKGYQTYHLVFGADCLGDTAYVTGDKIEHPYDSTKTTIDVKWRNHSYGTEKAISSTGLSILGSTLPEGETDAIMMAKWLETHYEDFPVRPNVKSLLEKLDVTAEEVYAEVLKVTEENKYDKEEARQACKIILGLADVLPYSTKLDVYCINKDTGEETKGSMVYYEEMYVAKYVYEYLKAGKYTFKVVDPETLTEIESIGTDYSENDVNGVEVNFDFATGCIRFRYGVVLPSFTVDNLETEVDNFVEETQSGSIYKEETKIAFDLAVEEANKVIAKDSPTQEEIDNAYSNVNEAFNSLEAIGWVDSTPYLVGDSDESGDVNIVDATNVQMYVAKLSESDTMNCYSDVDVDFDLSIKDATMIQCYCAKLDSSCGNVGAETFDYYYDDLYN